MKKKSSKTRAFVYIAIAIFAGSATGLVLGPKASILGELAHFFIRTLKALATPLIFFAIVDAFCKSNIRARSGVKLLLISGVNATVAALIALFIGEFLPVESGAGFLEIARNMAHSGPSGVHSGTPSMDFWRTLSDLIPHNIFEPFIENNVISVVLISIILGVILKRLKANSAALEDYHSIQKFFGAGLRLITAVLGWIVHGVPLAVFGIVAQAVGVNGFGFLTTLGMFVLRIVLGISIYIFAYFSIVLLVVARISPLKFFKTSAAALMTAFGTGSSLATLPVTLETLQEKMRISPESSRLAACVGTNLNHNGILLYEAMAALFIAHIHGIHLGFSQKLILFGTSVLAAAGIAGIPDAGLITLSLVLSASGLPLTLVPLLMTVDWFIGRLRATANVTTDLVVGTLLDRVRISSWLSRLFLRRKKGIPASPFLD